MKRVFLILIVLCTLVGCTRSEVQGEGDSYVTVSTVADASLNIKQTKASGYTIPLPADYSYTVRHMGDKSVVAEGGSTAGLGTLALMAGNYLFEVASVGEASLDRPSYAGSATFSVKKGATAAVEVKAKLASAVVEVRFSDAVKSGFSSYKATISAQEQNQTAVFDASTPEGTLVYLPAPATKVTCTIDVVSAQGIAFQTEQTVDALAAADLLAWTVDIPAYTEKPTDPLVLELVLNQTLNEVQKNFTLSVDPTATGSPTILGADIDHSLPIAIKLGEGIEAHLNLKTPAKLDKVLLLFDPLQKPIADCPQQAVVDVLALSDAERAQWGVSIDKDGGAGQEKTVLDLSAMTKKMPGTKNAAKTFFLTIGLLDKNGTYVTRKLEFNVYDVSLLTLGYLNAEKIDWFGEHGPINRVNVRLQGQYNVDDVPDGLAFQYRRQGEDVWQVADPTINTSTKAVYADLPLLADGSVWEYRLSSAEENGTTVQLPVMPTYPVLADMDFEKMLTGKVDQGRWDYKVTPWGYSNSGFGGDNVTKTTSYNGSVCPKIQADVVLKNFASGGLFSGFIDVDIMNVSNAYVFSKVGVPIAIRPKQLKGMYKYEGKRIDNYNNGSVVGNGAVNGGDDHFEIAVKLEKWGAGDYKTRWRDGFYGNPGSSYNGKAARFATPLREQMAVGYGQLISGQSTDWKSFVIDIEYSQNVMPDRVIITAVSSAWGGYMTGGRYSTLYIDDLEFVY